MTIEKQKDEYYYTHPTKFIEKYRKLLLKRIKDLKELIEIDKLSEGKTIKMKIGNINNYGNLQIADLIVNSSADLSENDKKIIQLIHDNVPEEKEREELIANLKTIRSEVATEEEKKKSGGIIGKFVEAVSSESGKQLVKELFENGDKILEYLQCMPF